jgi:multifunctional beta-oxidation protein
VDDLQWTYEGASDFKAFPTFGLIPQMHAATLVDFKEIFPTFSLSNLLHAGQHLKIHRLPIPTSGSFTSSPRLLEVLDKGSAALATVGISTVEDATGNEIFYNETTIFLRNCGGFGGAKATSRNSTKGSCNTSKPVYSIAERTTALHPALYRLNGDLNPLHIDPAAARASGFQQPIIHGLCSLSISSKHVLDKFGPVWSVGGKFVGSVIPTQTLRTDMWTDDTRQPTKVFFQTTIVETGKLAIADGVAELSEPERSRL